VDTSDPTALQKPLLTIPPSEFIPTSPTTFQIHLPCSGLKSTEVLVTLSLNVTADPKFKPLEIVPVLLKRKKVCLEGRPDSIDPAILLKKVSSSKVSSNSNNGGSGNSSKKSLYSTSSFSKKLLGSVVPNTNEQALIPLEDEYAKNENPSIVLKNTPPSTILLVILASSLGFILILLSILTAAYIRTKRNSVHSSSRGFLQHM